MALDLIGSYSPSSLANIAESNGVVNTYKRCEESRIVLGWSPIIRESATLLYPNFSNFANNVRNQNVEDPDDPRIEYARKYIPILRNHFSNEAKRRKSFCKMLQTLIPELTFHEEFHLTEEQMGGKVVVLRSQGGQPGEKPRKTKKNKAKQTIVKEKSIAKYIQSNVIGASEKSRVHEEVPVVIAEIKNEEGCTTSEPLVEAMGYYNCFALAATLANNSIPLLWPSLIILHVGKSIRVYGAVTFIRVNPESQQREPHYLCEHLYSLQLNDHDEKALQEMCKFLVVLCDQVKSILEFRSVKGMDPGCAGIPFLIRDDPNFLRQTGFVELIPNTHVYVNGCYVWKFTRHYSQEAHERAAELKIAPKLHYCNTLGEWKLVCMQKVSGEMVNHKTLRDNQELWNEFNQRVALFHEAGFVHGDMRQQNIMFGSLPGQEAKSFFILDFDWAGKENQVRYPISINMDGNIKWPVGVCPRGIISSDHDTHWLSTHK